MDNNINSPFIDGELKERILDLKNLKKNKDPEQLSSRLEQEQKEAMELYNEIAEIFIKRKTELTMSYVVLAAMADAMFTYITIGRDE